MPSGDSASRLAHSWRHDVKKPKKLADIIGRIGPEAAIALRNRNGGPMDDRRLGRLLTRAARKRRRVEEDLAE